MDVFRVNDFFRVCMCITIIDNQIDIIRLF